MLLLRFLAISWLIPTFISSSVVQHHGSPSVSASAGGSITRLLRAVDIAKKSSRILDVDFSDPSNATKSIETLLDAQTTCRQSQIRDVRVKGYSSLGNWTLLERVFGQLESIEAVYWEAYKPIPPEFLRHFQKHPAIRLHYTPKFTHNDPYDSSLKPEDDWDPYDTPWDSNYKLREERDHQYKAASKSVINSTSLYALKADIEYGSDDNFDDLEFVFEMISNSPNLRELDLHINTRGCLLGHSPFAFDFLSNPSARFPPLEVLRLKSYRLDERADGGYVWGYKDFVEDPRTSWSTLR